METSNVSVLKNRFARKEDCNSIVALRTAKLKKMYHLSTKRLFVGKVIYIYLLPAGKSGKCFIDETTRLIHAWLRGSLLKNIALKTVMIIPRLLLQKPSKDSKTRVNTKALEKRLQLCSGWRFAKLLKGDETIQSCLKQITPKTLEKLSKEFVEPIEKGNAVSAIKIITNNMQNGILYLTDTTLKLLKASKSILSLKKSFCLINLKVFIKSNTKISMQMQFSKLAKSPWMVPLDLREWMQMVRKGF